MYELSNHVKPFKESAATGRVYIVKVSGGRYEGKWVEIEGVFSTLKKAKNYRRKRTPVECIVDKEHTVEVLTYELDKPCR